ncbi:MAG TPA: tetratricopeptide repeat protein, partial [Planctomycetota bacterium]|nr:tetratricopeptide repeat protein [Planctomycetota bacterium]
GENAESLAEQAWEGYRTYSGEDHPSTLEALLTYARMLGNHGKPEQAERLFRIAVERSRTEPGVCSAHRALGNCLAEQSKFEEAEQHLVRSLEGYEKLRGKGSQRSLGVAADLLRLYEKGGLPDKAAEVRALLREAPPKPDSRPGR